MKKEYIIFILIGIILLLVMIIVNLARSPKTSKLPPEEKKLAVSVSIPSWDQENALNSFRENVEKIDSVSFFWYYLNSSGNIEKYRNAVEDRSAIDFAHRNNVKVLAIITNLDDDDSGEEQWDAERVNTVIATEEGRKQHSQALVELTQEMNFDGISIDYELLDDSQREDFSLFIEELGKALHADGKTLAVAIHGSTSNEQSDAGAAAQDLRVISRAADQLYFMTYLEHVSSSPPGPAGSLEWTEQVLEYAVEEQGVPEEKIFLGIGLFGLEWQGNEDGSYSGVNNDLTYNTVQSILQQYMVTPMWDEQAGSNHFEFFEPDGRPHVVWFDNAQSVEKRVALAERWNLGGIFFWRLGGEDPGVWEEL